MNKLELARQVFDTEIEALQKTRDTLDETYEKAMDMITNCKGRVIVTGMGKPGHIAQKIAATMASLGTPAFCMHPAEALHGDLGMVTNKDIIIAISYSGESEEVISMLPGIRWLGAKMIAVSGNPQSTLVKNSDLALIFPSFAEACPMGLAPTSSTTAALVLGDSLAVVASQIYGYTKADYGRRHPAGTLGKKVLIRVSDIMHTGEQNAVLTVDATLKETIVELSRKMLGIVSLVDHEGRLAGVITDGDIRRLLERSVDIYQFPAHEIMIRSPKWTSPGTLAVDALDYLRDMNISCLPVVTEDMRLLGTIRMRDILQAGVL